MCRVLVLAVVVAAACEADPHPSVVVADSAGVRTTSTRHEPTTFARVDTAPALDLGSADATGPTQFFRIAGLHVGPDGRLWVADGRSAELRIFEADGTHWKTRGGRGQGPEEFLRIRLLGPLRGDTVAVGDDADGRVTFFDPAGEPARGSRLPDVEDAVPLARGIFRDGSVLARVPRILQASSLEPGRILADTVRLVRVDPDDGTARPWLLAPGPLWLWTGRSQVPVPFTINASFAVRDGSVHLVGGPDFRVRVFEGGRLTEIYGLVRDARPVTGADLRAYRTSTEEYVQEPLRTDYLAALDHPSRPDLLPAWARLLVARDGRVWVRRYDPDPGTPGVWDVFDVDRAWLGRVEMPPGFMLLDVAGDRLAGVWRDELDVEHVRVYRLGVG